jgi:hypothetical protein
MNLNFVKIRISQLAMVLTLSVLLASGVTFAGDLPQQTSTADLNGDGTVNLIDFAILSACWMADCSCNGKVCGGDGCGASCGACGQNETCDNGQCVLDCTNNGFVAVTETASEISGNTIYTAQTNPTEPFDQLSLENYPSQGGLIRGGQWTFTGQNYANCGVCVLIYQNVNGGVPDKIFLAESGTLNLTSIGGVGSQLTGSFTDLVLIEVTIDSQTFISTPVPNGDNWCIDTYSFDVTIN